MSAVQTPIALHPAPSAALYFMGSVCGSSNQTCWGPPSTRAFTYFVIVVVFITTLLDALGSHFDKTVSRVGEPGTRVAVSHPR